MNIETIKTISHLLKSIENKINVIHYPGTGTGQEVILMYHGISKRPKFNCVTANLFREQLAWLTDNYIVVPLSILIEKLSAPSPIPLKLAAITFDDGYINFAELALPILRDYKCHATVFVPSEKAGCYNDWDRSIKGFHKMEIMSYDMIRQLPQEFVEIGSHGLSHRPLSQLPYNEIKREIVDSRLEIENKTGRPVHFFAFPFGVYPFRHKLQLCDAENHFMGGYNAACTTWWGRYNSLKDINTLRRVGIWDSDSFSDFIDKLSGYYDWLEKKERVGRYLKIMESYLR